MLRLNTLRVAVAIACSAIGSAAATELPSRKPGLWDMKTVFERPQLLSRTSQHCIDAETDKQMTSTMTGNMNRDMCSKIDVQKVGDTYIVDAMCQTGPSGIHGMIHLTTHSVLSGDFNSAYTMKVSSLSGFGRPAQPTDGKAEMTLDARWIGACEPDQKPGDMMSPGVKVNVRDLLKARNLVPGASPQQ